MRIVILQLFLISSQWLFGNFITYYNHINEGEYLMYEGHYEMAVVNFEMAFEIVDQPKARDYFCISKCYSQLKREDKTYQYLDSAVKNGYNKTYILSDSLWYNDYFKSNTYNSIMAFEDTAEIVYSGSEIICEKLDNSIDYKKNREFIQFYFKGDTNSQEFIDFIVPYNQYYDSIQKIIIQYCLNNEFPQNRNIQDGLIYMVTTYTNNELKEYDAIKKWIFSALEKGVITPIQYKTFAERSGFMYYNFNSDYSNYSTLEQKLINRKEIGMSTYFVNSPNYSNNYLPEPIRF